MSEDLPRTGDWVIVLGWAWWYNLACPQAGQVGRVDSADYLAPLRVTVGGKRYWSGKVGVCHPSYYAAWAQKTRAQARKRVKPPKLGGLMPQGWYDHPAYRF